jgi:DNA repair protein RecO (recombination protein O)
MSTYRTEGIILQAVKFQDFDQIVTCFTGEEGILRFMVKGALNPKLGKAALTAPLSRAEFIYSKGRSELYSCREISMLNSHLALRENVLIMESAFDHLQAVRATQMPQKGAPELYKLLLIYLEKLPLIPDPKVLSSSFRLKTLRHEGLLNFDSSHFSSFLDVECELLYALATLRSFAELAELRVSPMLCQKVRHLFEELTCS